MTSRLSTPFDPWTARFGFIWYNDDEIFRYTDEDFDRKAREFADRGINIVITFSCTHFRWSMYDYRDEIAKCIGKIVEACHKYDIRVVEHHSSSLSFDPLNDDEVDYAKRTLKIRHSSIDTWPEMVKHWQSDRLINGVSMHSMRQIDGRTGELARSNYRGWVMCPNNEDFRREYLSYLESVYDLGVDGIMTDDMQLFAFENACACPTCRRLFKEKTGYEMPQPGEAWEKWHNDYDDPSFIAWQDFRLRSIESFHHAVADHYRNLGFRPLRPNYCSNVLGKNWSAYCLDSLPDLDWVAAECCFSNIIRYAWQLWAVEMMHRFAIGRARDIPVNAYFYPDRPDSMLFTWALCKSFGGLWVPTPEGAEAPEKALEMEATLRAFERKHQPLYRRPQKVATLGFYDSRRNRELTGLHRERYFQLHAWLHSCYRNNVPCDLFVQEEFPQRLDAYRTVVLNTIELLSDEELQAFVEFARKGGTVIWTGVTGTKDLQANPRDKATLLDILELKDFEVPTDDSQQNVYQIGKGKLITVSDTFGTDAFFHWYGADRWLTPPATTEFGIDTPTQREAMKRLVDLINEAQGGADIITENLLDDMIVSLFHQPDADCLTLHVINGAGTMERKPDDIVGHGDEIPFLQIESGVPVSITLKKRAPQAKREFKKAIYRDPLRDDVELDLTLSQDSDQVVIEIPSDKIREYGLIELR